MYFDVWLRSLKISLKYGLFLQDFVFPTYSYELNDH